MELEKAIVIPLHQNWDYLDFCCDMINEEWPRSTTARMHSLKASSANLPTSLILVLYGMDTNEQLVIGHSKISPILRCPSACFVESVVIAKKFRGKGWGRYIMQETEKYAKEKGRTVIFLSTSDKEDFYSKVGYSKCDPVSIYGCKSFQIKSEYQCTLLAPNNAKAKNGSERLPPPPPLPPPTKTTYNTKVYMMKIVS